MADWWPRTRMSMVAWVLFGAAIVVTIAGFSSSGAPDLAVAGVAAGIVVAAIRAWWPKRSANSRAWWGFVGALIVSASADIAAALLSLVGLQVPAGPMLVAHIGTYMVVVVVIFVLAQRRVNEGRAAVTLDAMTFSTAVTLLLAASMLHDNRVAVPAAVSAEAAPWVTLALSYFLAVGLGMLWFADGNQNPWAKYVSLGSGWITFTAFHSLLTSGGDLAPEGLHGGLIMYATALLALQALGDKEPLISAGYTSHPARSFALVACLLSPWVLILVGAEVPWLIIGLAALVLNVVVLVRLALLVQVVHDRNQRLQRLAERDPLTQVYNRGHFEQLCHQCDPRAATVWVGLIDLDYFKRFNDMFGHQEGDSVLYESAQNWSRVLRKRGVVSRYGGEEFAFLLHDEDEAGAWELAEQLRLAVPEGLTCSVGVAQWAAGEEAYSAIHRADVALYQVKADGRDSVLFDAELPTGSAASGQHPGEVCAASRRDDDSYQV